MRYSQGYLEGLLNSDDVLAIFELDAIIMSSARVDIGKPQFGLTTPSFHVHLCLGYVGEVGNGGHVQYFFNQLGEYASDTIVALRVMGLDALGRVLETAVSLFPPSFTTKSQDERIHILEQLTDDQHVQLSNLDRQVYAVDQAAFAIMKDYLREQWTFVQKDLA